jgi:hypothetical protein
MVAIRKGQKQRTFCQNSAPSSVADWDIINRQKAQYELKIMVTKKRRLSFEFLFKKKTLTAKVMEIALANNESRA